MGRPALKIRPGDRFGLWTVVDAAGKENGRRSSRGGYLYLCRCDCGTRKTVVGFRLRSGHSKSCGPCLAGTRNYKHGHSSSKRSAEYRVWSGIKWRCSKNSFYVRRGITVCDRWKDSFEDFLADVGPRPDRFHSLDRIDNDRGYEPGNVRWATTEEQAFNRSNTIKLTFQGKTQSLFAWSREIGVSRATIKERLTHGWSVEDALTRPVQKKSFSKSKGWQYIAACCP